ncbi:F0F1 ATP synthase subunit delta [Candidatus Uhrbacteria bacterium]|nr:F0F1 ATP synthase subunit delta [Candidatus Uhrbacteria bacterium]
MRISAKTYAVALYQALDKVPAAQQKKIISNFLRELLRRNDFKMVNKILLELERYIDEISQKVKLQVTSAKPLPEKIKKEIREIFKKKLGVKEIGLSEVVAPKVLGGVRFNWGDQTIDVTLKKRLEQLKTHLVRA